MYSYELTTTMPCHLLNKGGRKVRRGAGAIFLMVSECLSRYFLVAMAQSVTVAYMGEFSILPLLPRAGGGHGKSGCVTVRKTAREGKEERGRGGGRRLKRCGEGLLLLRRKNERRKRRGGRLWRSRVRLRRRTRRRKRRKDGAPLLPLLPKSSRRQDR